MRLICNTQKAELIPILLVMGVEVNGGTVDFVVEPFLKTTAVQVQKTRKENEKKNPNIMYYVRELKTKRVYRKRNF